MEPHVQQIVGVHALQDSAVTDLDAHIKQAQKEEIITLTQKGD